MKKPPLCPKCHRPMQYKHETMQGDRYDCDDCGELTVIPKPQPKVKWNDKRINFKVPHNDANNRRMPR